MLSRVGWFLCMLIYLSINGQVFATQVHLCPAMAQSSVTSMSSSDSLKIHDHHHMEAEVASDEMQSEMKNCQCVDCDCTANMVVQANSSLTSNIDLAVYVPLIECIISNQDQDFISQPCSNPLRPPIVV